MKRRLERGETLVGMKMGLTSRAKMEQMGVHEPIYGALDQFDDRQRRRSHQAVGELCHPAHRAGGRIYPEGGPARPGDVRRRRCRRWPESARRWRSSTAATRTSSSPCRMSSPTIHRHRASCSGSGVPVEGVNLGNLGIIMEVNGKIAEIGSSAAIYEHPARSLAELANMLARRGRAPAGRRDHPERRRHCRSCPQGRRPRAGDRRGDRNSRGAGM